MLGNHRLSRVWRVGLPVCVANATGVPTGFRKGFCKRLVLVWTSCAGITFLIPPCRKTHRHHAYYLWSIKALFAENP